MFTGRKLGKAKLTSAEQRREQFLLVLEDVPADIAAGETLLLNGVAASVKEVMGEGKKSIRCVMPWKLAERTNLQQLEAGQSVNLERSPLASERLAGHWVRGKVDTLATLLHKTEAGNDVKITVALEARFGRYCIEGGAITLDGVAAEIQQQQATRQGEFIVSVLLPPAVVRDTRLAELAMGASINVEVDIIARYVERLVGRESLLAADEEIAQETENKNAVTPLSEVTAH